MSPFRIKRFISELTCDILDFVYPQSCAVCQNSLKREENDICEECWSNLTLLPFSFCPYCKLFFEDDQALREHECPYLAFPQDRRILAVRSLGSFDDYYQRLIHRFKYDKKVPLGKRLAHRLGEVVAGEENFRRCDLVIPVPLHSARRRERGFNQSQILAEEISRAMDLPLDKDVLKRKKNTKDQTYLDTKERAENVRNAFMITQAERVKDKKVILVDDVITTGATLNECARMLQMGGAKEILASTLAVVADRPSWS